MRNGGEYTAPRLLALNPKISIEFNDYAEMA